MIQRLGLFQQADEMPKLHIKEKALQGKAEVLSYAHAPERFYLRFYVPATAERARHYRSVQLSSGTLSGAHEEALEAYLKLQSEPVVQGGQSREERKTKTTPFIDVELYALAQELLAKDVERVEAGE